MHSILIIHNGFGDKSDPLYLSRYGVMEEVDAVAAAMDRAGIDYDVADFDNLRQLSRYLNDCDEEIIFNLVEEFTALAEDACYVPALCEAFGKSCTGSASPSLVVCRNKAHAKSILRGASLPVADGIVIDSYDSIEKLLPRGGRFLIKPTFCDAGEGIDRSSVVALPGQRPRAIELIGSLLSEFGGSVIVERYLDGREFNVSLLQSGDQVKVIAVAEIDFSAFDEDMPRIVDYDAKWNRDSFGYNNTPRVMSPAIEADQLDEIKRISLGAWKAGLCRDYARVDIRTDENSNPFILEVNPNPDISPDGGFAAALEHAGISYEKFVATILNNAADRLKLNRSRSR
jgi:D-alanine-D-alanine ligase